MATVDDSDDEPWQDEQWLKEKYEDEGLTYREIAELVPVTQECVAYWVRQYDIETRDVGGKPRKYSNEELLEWIEAFVQFYGVSPTTEDLRGWPGPSPETYRNRYGSLREAVKAAGYEPRGQR